MGMVELAIQVHLAPQVGDMHGYRNRVSGRYGLTRFHVERNVDMRLLMQRGAAAGTVGVVAAR